MSGNGELYIVATPIGNLDDLSPRAVGILAEVDLIAAEDTRHTRKLLTRFGIKAEMISYFRGREAERSAAIIARIHRGGRVALVSDAGTPGISDPGWFLVDQALIAGIRVIPVPGPCAAAALVSVAGFAGPGFLFLGFLPPKKKARCDLLSAWRDFDHDLLFYESPRRIIGTLADIITVMGERRLAIGRELTKLNEEIIRGPAPVVLDDLVARPAIKGEFVVMVEHRQAPVPVDDETVFCRLRDLRGKGYSLKDSVAEVSRELKIGKKKVYGAALVVWDKKGLMAAGTQEEDNEN